MFLRIKWFTNDSPSGSVSVSGLQVFGCPLRVPLSKYLLCLSILVVIGLLAKNLVRSAIGREWMAIRDMDVAASVIGIRPMYAKLSAFAVSSFIVGVAGALWGFVYLGAWEPAAFSVDQSFNACCSWSSLAAWAPSWAVSLVPLSSCCCRFSEPVPAVLGQPGGCSDFNRRHFPCRADHLWCADCLVPDCGTARIGQAVVHWQAENAPVAVPALICCFFPFVNHRHVNADLRRLHENSQHRSGQCAGCCRCRRVCPGQGAVLPRLPYRTGPTHPMVCHGPTAMPTTSS
jgi:hypothetical protein